MSQKTDSSPDPALLSVILKNRTCLIVSVAGIALLVVLVAALVALSQGNTSSIKGEDVASACRGWIETTDAATLAPRSGPLGRIWTYDTDDGTSLDLIFDYTVANSLEELDTLICIHKQVFRSTTHYCTSDGDAFESLSTIAVVDWRAKKLRALRSFAGFLPVCATSEAKAMISSSPDTFKVEEWLTGVEQGRIE